MQMFASLVLRRGALWTLVSDALIAAGAAFYAYAWNNGREPLCAFHDGPDPGGRGS